MSGREVLVLVLVAQLWVLEAEASWPRTTDSPQNNLAGKMVTLSSYGGGGISFYPPYYSFDRPEMNTTNPGNLSWYTTPTGYWTTPQPRTGFSVCVRVIKELLQSDSVFQVDPSGFRSLWLTVRNQDYMLSLGRYQQGFVLSPNLLIWPNIYPEIWTRVCLVMDGNKNVAQLFSGTKMSARKLMPPGYRWSGRPVISFSDFDGQVTDVQMWDYPVNTNIIFYYMSSGAYRGPAGSVLSWSNINYSATTQVLVEDNYGSMLEEEAGPQESQGQKKKNKKCVEKGERMKKGGRMRNQL